MIGTTITIIVIISNIIIITTTSLPMFMRDVLKYDLDTSGILAAFPYILMAIVVQVGNVKIYIEANRSTPDFISLGRMRYVDRVFFFTGTPPKSSKYKKLI